MRPTQRCCILRSIAGNRIMLSAPVVIAILVATAFSSLAHAPNGREFSRTFAPHRVEVDNERLHAARDALAVARQHQGSLYSRRIYGNDRSRGGADEGGAGSRAGGGIPDRRARAS